jgi:hypothetical protein
MPKRARDDYQDNQEDYQEEDEDSNQEDEEEEWVPGASEKPKRKRTKKKGPKRKRTKQEEREERELARAIESIAMMERSCQPCFICETEDDDKTAVCPTCGCKVHLECFGVGLSVNRLYQCGSQFCKPSMANRPLAEMFFEDQKNPLEFTLQDLDDATMSTLERPKLNSHGDPCTGRMCPECKVTVLPTAAQDKNGKYNRNVWMCTECSYCGFQSCDRCELHPDKHVVEGEGRERMKNLAEFCFATNEQKKKEEKARMLKEQESESAKLVAAQPECPNCKAKYTKDGGCNHMKCVKCKHHFCHVCLANLTPLRNPYNHFGVGRCQMIPDQAPDVAPAPLRLRDPLADLNDRQQADFDEFVAVNGARNIQEARDLWDAMRR